MRIDVLDPRTQQRVFTCAGPTTTGSCPRVEPQEQPPCSGMVLQPVPPRGSWKTLRFKVVGETPACPLRCLAG